MGCGLRALSSRGEYARKARTQKNKARGLRHFTTRSAWPVDAEHARMAVEETGVQELPYGGRTGEFPDPVGYSPEARHEAARIGDRPANEPPGGELEVVRSCR